MSAWPEEKDVCAYVERRFQASGRTTWPKLRNLARRFKLTLDQAENFVEGAQWLFCDVAIGCGNGYYELPRVDWMVEVDEAWKGDEAL